VPGFVSSAITICVVVLCIDAAVQGVLNRRFGRAVLLIAAYLCVAGVLRLLTGYPNTRVAFGNAPTVPLVAMMFVCIVVGMAARYWFYLRGRFSWSAFLRPLFVSPLVLLPLLGTLQPDVRMQPVQVISVAILAFQNGFFWRTVFEKAKP
jgi:hypothetical protein